ncbi:prolyl oligopeptidase family serine peptidase [Candidatus Gottesmanbacteria bacterium]|nr:prolyl oligopeptidase family serine peptidase [Candidatus Gottesmanbacteria bacterium]
MRKVWVLIVLFFFGLFFLFLTNFQKQDRGFISPLGKKEPGLLEKYTFENLRKREFLGGEIRLERVLSKEGKYTAYLFFFESDGRKISGQANLPKGSGPFPVVVMLRGYVDNKIYSTGMGTKKPAGFFAENGFLTLAPDFLGFGESDDTYSDILEDRFARPVTVLELLASIKTLKQADSSKVVIWGHSNGGQIALSVLEISQKSIPTTLWAPVTKGFPESVLTYMSQLDDLGVKVKQRIDDFVKDYDPKKFSIDNYFQDIKAPLQIHQGTGDEYIEVGWTNDFVNKLKSLAKDVTYYTYKGDDHNLRINWDTVVARDLEFFQKNLTKK